LSASDRRFAALALLFFLSGAAPVMSRLVSQLPTPYGRMPRLIAA